MPTFFKVFSVLFLCCNISYGQIKGQVVSKADRQPIPYATVFLKNASLGVHTDENGNFELISTSIISDSIYIQSIGYKTLKIAYSNSKDVYVFALEESPITLQAVEVRRNKRIKSIWVGAAEDHTGFMFGQMGGSVLREAALYIPNEEHKEGFLREIGFFVVRFGQPKTPFRVRIYKPNNGVPGDDLLTENLVVHASRGNSYCVVDVSRFAIPFGKEGVYISMEWLNLADKKYVYTVKMSGSKATRTFYGQQIGLTGEFDELRGKERINNGPWKTMTAGFSSPMFKAKIDVYE